MAQKFINHPDQGGLMLQGGEWHPECYKTALWRPPSMELPSWKGVKRIGLDTEGCDPQLKKLGPGVRRDGFTVGISFAIEDGPKYYLPFGHQGGDNLDREQVYSYIKDQFKTFDGEVVGMNLSYDLDYLWEAGVHMPHVKAYRDVSLADPLLNELEQSYNLDNIAKRLGFAGKNEDGLRVAAEQYHLDPKADLWRMPARHVGEYAEDDAALPLLVLRKQETRMDDQGLLDVFDMESKLLPVLLRMRRRGIRVNLDRLEKVEEWTRQQEAIAFAKVKDATGIDIPVGQSMNVDLIARALKAVDIPVPVLASGKESVKKDVLAVIKHPVAEAIVRARQVARVRTFGTSIRNHLTNGRIHCTFNQMKRTDDDTDEDSGARFGRMSASSPNMQNQPGNSRFSGDNQIGPMWRAIYEPEEGELWCACDLKQQEPKWSFHYSALVEQGINERSSKMVQQVRGALKLCERLNADPTMDTYDPIVQVAGVSRPTAKIMWLARCYGQGEGKLCDNLGLPSVEVVYDRAIWAPVPVDSERGQELMRQPGAFSYRGAGEEGKKIIDKFDGELPFLKVMAKIAKSQADKNGYVTLLGGRRCHFEKNHKGEYEFTYKAFNRLIQGTAAEQTKRIMLAIADTRFGDKMLLQVHDELDFSLPSVEDANEAAAVMKSAVPMLVPTVVDVECGPSWGEAMTIEEVIDGKKTKRYYRWNI